MPSDSFFGFSVLIAGRPVPEYVHNGRVFVESNLWTPFSYNQPMEEYVNGEKEQQKCPVTPYQLLIHLAPHCETSVIFVYVDGVRVTKMILERGQSRYVSNNNLHVHQNLLWTDSTINCSLVLITLSFPLFSLFRVIRGFEDKEGIREFLFALPRFAVSEVNQYYCFSKGRSSVCHSNKLSFWYQTFGLCFFVFHNTGW